MDTVICILTLWKTRQYIKDNVKTPYVFSVTFYNCTFLTEIFVPRILQVLTRDGILYFAVIFCANLLNVLIFSVSSISKSYESFFPNESSLACSRKYQSHRRKVSQVKGGHQAHRYSDIYLHLHSFSQLVTSVMISHIQVCIYKTTRYLHALTDPN